MALCFLVIKFFVWILNKTDDPISYNSTKSQNPNSNGETAGDNADNI